MRRSTTQGLMDVSILLDKVLKKPVFKNGMDSAALKQLWNQVVGEQVAQQVEFLEIRQGIILLKSHSASWKNEVIWQKKAILDRSNVLLGKTVAKDLRFV